MERMLVLKLRMSAGPHHSALRGFTQQPPKGDDGGHAGAVEEEEGGQTLQADGVGVVRQVVRGLPLDVQDEPSKEPTVK